MKTNWFFFLLLAFLFGACSRPSGCPSTFITTPKISQRDVNRWFAFKEKKQSNYREQSFFSMKTGSYRNTATQKSFFAMSSKKNSSNTERNFFGTFTSSKNKYRDMDAFSSKPKKTRAQKEASLFSSPYRKQNRAGNQDFFSVANHSGSNKTSKDFFSSSNRKQRQKASYNRAEDNPFGSRAKKKEFVARKDQPDLFEPKVMWYKGKKRDPHMPKDSMGKEGEAEKEKD